MADKKYKFDKCILCHAKKACLVVVVVSYVHCALLVCNGMLLNGCCCWSAGVGVVLMHLLSFHKFQMQILPHPQSTILSFGFALCSSVDPAVSKMCSVVRGAEKRDKRYENAKVYIWLDGKNNMTII